MQLLNVRQMSLRTRQAANISSSYFKKKVGQPEVRYNNKKKYQKIKVFCESLAK